VIILEDKPKRYETDESQEVALVYGDKEESNVFSSMRPLGIVVLAMSMYG
jgi:hypothetical protein